MLNQSGEQRHQNKVKSWKTFTHSESRIVTLGKGMKYVKK